MDGMNPCPTCGGSGKVPIFLGLDNLNMYPPAQRVCVTCCGSGWVIPPQASGPVAPRPPAEK